MVRWQRAGVLLALVAVATAVLQPVGAPSLPVVGAVVVPAAGIAFAAGRRLGERGAVAAAIGVGVGGLVAGLASPVHVASTAATLAFALAAARGVGAASRIAGDGPAGWAGTARTDAVVAVVGALPAAALTGSLLSLSAGTPFFVVAPAVLGRFAVTGVLAGVLLAVGRRVTAERTDLAAPGEPRAPDEAVRTGRLVLVAVGWLVVGGGIDLAATLARIVPTRFYASRLGLDVTHALFTHLQIAGQVLLLGVVATVLWRWRILGIRAADGETDEGPDAGSAPHGHPPAEPGANPASDAASEPSDGGENAVASRLTRRDAVVALAALGVVEIGTDFATGPGDGPLTDDERAQLRAAAEVLYPSAVSVDADFLRTYVTGRYSDRPTDRRRLQAALAFLDDVAGDRFGTRFTALPVADRERVLHAIGVDRVGSVADGRQPEQVRYYVVNDLLYALYASPLGGRLVGRDNPTGYAGGLDAYQRGPDA